MDKSSLYLYPMRSIADMSKGPYIEALSEHLSEFVRISNLHNKDNSIPRLFRSFKFFDIYYLNWIENISGRNSGLLLVWLWLARFLGKTIIWTHHNRHPHQGRTSGSERIMNWLTNYADYIVIHTAESYEILGFDRDDERIIEFFHPFFDPVRPTMDSKQPDIDLLIWGNVRESKGVFDFIKYINEKRIDPSLQIYIIGRFASEALFEQFTNLNKLPNVRIENRFVAKTELLELHRRSRYVFFPYTGTSVLNSGALVTSLPMMTPIIGPNSGAFKDVAQKGFCFTYSNFEEVLQIVKEGRTLSPGWEKRLINFISQHSWENFSEVLSRKILN